MFNVLSAGKFYWLEVEQWKEGSRGREEDHRVLFVNMIIPVA